MALLGKEEGGTSIWKWVGGMGVLAGVLILSYYGVIAGWVIAYIGKSVSGAFTGATAATIEKINADFIQDWPSVAIVFSVFMGITVFVVARGVERGLEKAVRFMVPALIILLLALLAYAANSGHFGQGISFMFTPDFDALTWNGVLIAMGQAFFTLSVGMGAVMAYGAYLPQETSITSATAAVVAADTVIAILAGLVIFPLVFANGLNPASGPALVFVTLPLAFGQMTGGVIFATIFFVLLAFAAWTSAIALMEPAVAWIVERFQRTRAQAAILIGAVTWVLGFGTVLSFGDLSEFQFLKGTIYDNVDYLTSNIMLPLGGLFITGFAGWVMCRNSTSEELGGAGDIYKIWRFLSRFVAPIAIMFIFLKAVGLLDFADA
jgi:NSS family neurotransmitter:Na+ symporter